MEVITNPLTPRDVGNLPLFVEDYSKTTNGPIIDSEVNASHKVVQDSIPITRITETVVTLGDNITTQVAPMLPAHHMPLYVHGLDNHPDIFTVNTHLVKLWKSIGKMHIPDLSQTRRESL